MTQNQPVFIPLLAYWSLNDTFPYKVQESKLTYNKDETVKDSTGNEYMLSLVVSDTTDSTYIIKVLKTQHLTDFSTMSMVYPELSQLAFEMESFQLEYVIDNNGSFIEPQNLDSLQRIIQRTLNHFQERLSGGNNSEAFLNLMEKFSSPEVTQVRFFDHLQSLHKFYGMEYSLDSTWIFTEEIENPLNPENAIHYYNEVLTTAPEDWNGLIRQQNTIVVEEEDAKILLRDALHGVASQKTIDDLLESNPPKIEMYISYVINPEWGVVYAMFCSKEIYMGGKLASKQTVSMELEGEW